MYRTIGGRHNPSLKRARKLQKKKFRTEHGFFLAEGWDVLQSALTAGVMPVEVLVRDDLAARLPPDVVKAAHADIIDVAVCPADVLADTSLLGGAADVVAIFKAMEGSLKDWDVIRGVTLYLYRIGDPGNVGTLVRSAVAFGASGVACSPETSDPFGPKALRGGMGAQFLVPIACDVTPEDLCRHVASRADDASGTSSQKGPFLVAADPRGSISSRELAAYIKRAGGHWRGGVVLVLGSERGDLPDFESDIWSDCLRVSIPQKKFDSLNVAMAGSILLYEISALLSDNGTASPVA